MAARIPTSASPGNWYVCSGEGPIPLSQGPGTFSVNSSGASTIDVLVYDYTDPAHGKILAPGDIVPIHVTAGLFLAPKPPDSGTAQGQYSTAGSPPP